MMSFGDVVRSAASPGVTPTGIGGDTNTIWHCDVGAPGYIYELSTTDFSTVRRRAVSSSSPEGSAQGIGGDANTIWNCADGYSKVMERSTTDLAVTRSANAPAQGPKGIGGDANVIWCSSDPEDSIYELDVSDFSTIRSGSSPSSQPMGTGGDAGAIWHSDVNTDLVYELSLSDFSAVRSANSPSTQPRGISGDYNKLWHCDRDADLIYELEGTSVAGDKYVDITTGNDSDSGDTWALAYLTVKKGIDNVAAGKAIHIAEGDYSAQAAIDLDKNLNLLCEDYGGGNVNPPLTVVLPATV